MEPHPPQQAKWTGVQVMGVLNVTPDSFFDGGRHHTVDAAVARAEQMVEEGADLIDVGGESSRPGAVSISLDEELRRVAPVVEALARRFPSIPLSVDTTKAEVARQALEAGAQIVNDISALRWDRAMAPLVARTHATVILMHMQGTPASMQDQPTYGDVVVDLQAFFEERIGWAERQGIARESLWLDPGIGFGKTVSHNLTLLRRLNDFHRFGCPLVVGTSRKSFLGKILSSSPAGLPLSPEERLEGSLATALWAALEGVQVLRVHDVQATVRVIRTLGAVRQGA
ncbi:MAG: dihydropteroate synthase [Elusimicrobia bacterium]|nr:dihydropteroate synthase [Elusimicrobiota bacterium]